MRSPKISIVTPVYDSAAYIEDCILSVINQKYKNLEYIVIDGGSSDGTKEIIEKYINDISIFISEKDNGQTQALNKGFNLATGEIYGWLNADEEYLPGTLNLVGSLFNENPKTEFFYGNRIVVDEKKNETGRTTFVKMHPKWFMLYRMKVVPTDTSFWRKSLHQKTGTLDEINFPQLSMDYDWLLRLSMNIRYWQNTNQFLSKFVSSKYNKTELASKEEIKSNSAVIRGTVIREHSISRLSLFLGWLIAGIYERWATGRTFQFPNIKKSLKTLFK